MSDVELREIDHAFGQAKILRGLNLRVDSGEYVVLLGESGCGKTTTLEVIAGLCTPDGGSVALGGRPVDDLAPRHRDVSIVFQNDALYPHLTVRESIAISIRGKTSKQEQPRRIEEAAELAGAADFLDRYPNRLSGGELRRGAIAKAIARHASVRLMDEPLSALDAAIRHTLQEDLLRWHRLVPGTTIHVTHDGQEAMRMADKIAVMEAGRIVQCAAPEQVYDHPASRTVALAVGSVPINLLQIPSDSVRCLHGFAVPRDVEVELGIRGESLSLKSHLTDGQSGVEIGGVVNRLCRVDGNLQASVQSGEQTLIAIVPADSGVAVGDACKLFAATERIHLFDSHSGRNLSAGSVEPDRGV